MGAEENKELVRRQFELLNAGDVDGAASLWAPESFNHGRKTDPNGISKVYESLRSLHERHTLHEMVAAGEWVAVRTTCTGVHSATPEIPVNGGIFVGLQPTNRSYAVQHVHLFRIVEGRLAEHWANRDDLGAARQIGLKLVPSSDSA
ncbi:MAG: ester cyclase [Thermoplasmata archaeon]|nr:ester cyclase [Thermoplasmata archaeon]